MADSVYSSDGPTCPYCGYELTPDDNFYYDVMRYTSETCPDCEKEYEVEVNIETTWVCTKKEEIASVPNSEIGSASNPQKSGFDSHQEHQDDKK